MKIKIILKFIYLLHQCVTILCSTKTWIPNTNFDDPKNWLGHKLPCKSSEIKFPENFDAAIYLPKNVIVKSIDLPNNGELILKKNGILEINTDQSSTCDKKEYLFKKINIEPWFKPSNWKSYYSENIAKPHSEKVPCVYDDVVFPNKFSFWVQYPEIPITVNNFQIEGQNLTNYQLQNFLLSEPGARQFKNFDYQLRTDVINVKNNECKDKTGCLCHNNQIIDKIVCRNLQEVCRKFHCLDPIKPFGHCCQFCGAYLIIKYNKNGFNFNKFKNEIQGYLKILGYDNIVNYVGKVTADLNTVVQIVIVEKNFTYNGESISAAQDLHQHLLSNLNQYKLLNSELYLSGQAYWPGQQLKTTITIVLTSLLLVLLSLTIIYFIFGTDESKKFSLPFNLPNFRNFRPFIFVRFENTGENEGLEFRNQSVASSLFNLDKAFDNPMYEPSTSQIVETVEMKSEENDENHFKDLKNPLYSELKSQKLSDEE